MSITYQSIKELDREKLQDLFLSVEWSSGNFPEKLQLAIRNSHSVYTAWDGEKLIGLMNALSDGTMTVYFPYLLVRPEYQGQGIGKHLIKLMLERYEDCARKTLIAYNTAKEFYMRCGFEAGEHTTPMSITYL